MLDLFKSLDNKRGILMPLYVPTQVYLSAEWVNIQEPEN